MVCHFHFFKSVIMLNRKKLLSFKLKFNINEFNLEKGKTIDCQ